MSFSSVVSCSVRKAYISLAAYPQDRCENTYQTMLALLFRILEENCMNREKAIDTDDPAADLHIQQKQGASVVMGMPAVSFMLLGCAVRGLFDDRCFAYWR